MEIFTYIPTVNLRRLKNIIYILLGAGVCVSCYYLFNWEIYPAFQILLCLLLGIGSLLISETVKNLKTHLKRLILATVLVQVILSFIVIISRELVVEYWRLVFIPCLFIVFISTYGLSLKKEEKYQPVFKWITLSLLMISFFRFFVYHEYIDYMIEFLFLIFIILIIRSKNKEPE